MCIVIVPVTADSTGYIDRSHDEHIILPLGDIVIIEDVTLKPGAIAEVPIRILNSIGVGGVTMTLKFDPTIVDVTNVVEGDFNSIFVPDYTDLDSGILRITCATLGADLTGDLIITTINLEAIGMSGSCGLELSAKLTDRRGNTVPSSVKNGVFTICDKIPGDVNGDTEVDISDAILLFNYVSFPNERGTTYVLSEPDNANVNGDDKVNIGDMVLLFNYVSFPNEQGTTYILQ